LCIGSRRTAVRVGNCGLRTPRRSTKKQSVNAYARRAISEVYLYRVHNGALTGGKKKISPRIRKRFFFFFLNIIIVVVVVMRTSHRGRTGNGDYFRAARLLSIIT
jgi:hypothetical protein